MVSKSKLRGLLPSTNCKLTIFVNFELSYLLTIIRWFCGLTMFGWRKNDFAPAAVLDGVAPSPQTTTTVLLVGYVKILVVAWSRFHEVIFSAYFRCKRCQQKVAKIMSKMDGKYCFFNLYMIVPFEKSQRILRPFSPSSRWRFWNLYLPKLNMDDFVFLENPKIHN